MKTETLTTWSFPYHQQNPNGRMLLTAAYLLRYHGYIYLANELNELGAELILTEPTNVK
jgi:hypothetical protein